MSGAGPLCFAPAGDISDKLQKKLASIKVISFDLDETLWPLSPTIENAEATLFQWLQQNTPRITDQYTQSQILEQRRQLIADNPELRGDVSYLRKLSLSNLFKEFSYEAETVDQAYKVFVKARSEVSLFEGVLPLLDFLRTHYRLAAITNGNADLVIAGVAQLFVDVQYATLDNPAKPDAAMFLRCADNLGVRPDEILHVGDNPVTDVYGGNEAGVMTAWFNPHRQSWPSDLDAGDIELTSLSELTRYLPGAD